MQIKKAPTHFFVLFVLVALLFFLPSQGTVAYGKAKSDTKENVTHKKKPSPAVTSQTPKTHGKTLITGKPDLVINKVWVDTSCRLKVELKNTGKTGIPTQSHIKGKLSVSIDKRTTTYSFARHSAKGPAVDPAGKLKRAGGIVVYTTGIIAAKGARVKVVVDSGKAIDESNENNNSMARWLAAGKCTPQTSKQSKAFPYDKRIKKQVRPGIKPKRYMRAQAGLKDIIAEHSVDFNTRPMSYDGGIRIRHIEDVTSYSFILRYEVETSLENSDITFYMLHGGDLVAQTTRPFTHGSGDPSSRAVMAQNFSWSIPVNLINDDNYGIIAVKSDGAGISDPFTVDLPYRPYSTGMGMSLEIESEDSFFFHGQDITLSIASTCGEPIDEVRLQLVRSGRRVGAGDPPVYDSSVLDTGGPFLSHHLPYSIPLDTPPGEYRFLALADISHCEHMGNPSAFSKVFTINPLRREAAGDRNQIEIRSPEGGDTIYTGGHSQLWVQWSCERCEDIDDLSYTRILLKDGEELQRIGPTHAGGDMSPMEWFNIFGYLSGADYQVRIELNRMNYETDTPEMIASETTGNFSIINNTMSYHSSTNPVLLRTPSGFGGASYSLGSSVEIMWSHSPARSTGHRVRLTLTRDSTEGGGEWPIASSIPVYPSTYDWTIPDHIPPGPGYRVLIERTDGAGASNSYIPFTITP